MEAIFQLILTTSLYASVVGLSIILLKKILKNKISPRWHYILWFVLFLKLAIPFGPQSAISLFNVMPKVSQTPNFTQQYRDFHERMDTRRQEKTIPTTYKVQEATLSIAALLQRILPYIWALGMIMFMLWLLFANNSLRRKIDKSTIELPKYLEEIFKDCKNKIGMKSEIALVIQSTITTPSIFGVLKPKILLSNSTLHLNRNEISYILLHELAHLKRKDTLINHLLLLFQAIHWFNPVIWYCFKLIREDMEVAADLVVLDLLQATEKKEYGMTLLNVIESFNSQKLAPRLIGMVDNKRNIERRIRMIKMADFFKSRRRIAILIGVVCIAVLGTILLTSGLTDAKGDNKKNNRVNYNSSNSNNNDSNNPDSEPNQYNSLNPTGLFSNKTLYVGNHIKVGGIIGNLPYSKVPKKLSLQTKSEPYGVTVNYDFTKEKVNPQQLETDFLNNATIMFALISNVEKISFICSVDGTSEQLNYSFTRAEVQKGFDKDLREYSKDKESLESLLKQLLYKLIIFPEKYSPFMSSTPGIKIMPNLMVVADIVKYSASEGVFLTWASDTGKISEYGPSVELPVGEPVYWSPRNNVTKEEIVVNAEIFNKGKSLTKLQFGSDYDKATLSYTVKPSSNIILGQAAKDFQKPITLDEAVSKAILDKSGSYRGGEVATEGHVILDTEEKEGIIKAYTISSFGWFAFENDVFTKISGSGNIPTVITFSKSETGDYMLLEYKEPQDGSGYLPSIKKMYPKTLWDKVINGHKSYGEIVTQQEEQAKQYLKSKGRTENVSISYVKKEPIKINVEASNKLLAELTKYDKFLNDCPYWIGTKEIVEEGVRYIYKTSQSKTSDNYDLLTFQKIKKEDGSIIEKRQYKIVGSEPILVK